MHVFVWSRVERASFNYHDEGGLTVFAPSHPTNTPDHHQPAPSREPELKWTCAEDDGSDAGPWLQDNIIRTRDGKQGWDETRINGECYARAR